jgi:hypothetical protein
MSLMGRKQTQFKHRDASERLVVTYPDAATNPRAGTPGAKRLARAPQASAVQDLTSIIGAEVRDAGEWRVTTRPANVVLVPARSRA